MQVKLFGKKHKQIDRLRKQYTEQLEDMAYWHRQGDWENYMISAKRASIIKQEILAVRRPKRWASFGFSGT